MAFILLSVPIAKVYNGVLDIFGVLGLRSTKKRREREEMECLINVWEQEGKGEG